MNGTLLAVDVTAQVYRELQRVAMVGIEACADVAHLDHHLVRQTFFTQTNRTRLTRVKDMYGHMRVAHGLHGMSVPHGGG